MSLLKVQSLYMYRYPSLVRQSTISHCFNSYISCLLSLSGLPVKDVIVLFVLMVLSYRFSRALSKEFEKTLEINNKILKFSAR